VITASEDSSASLPPTLVAGVPAQILHEDEVVLLLTKPSILFIFYSSFVFVLATLLLGILAARISSYNPTAWFSPTTVAFVTVVVCLGRLVWALLVWTSHIYMLTNLRILTIKGVLNVHMFQANLRKIQKTDLFRPLVLRLLGTGTLAYSTAAAADTFDSTWVMIARPIEVHEQVVAAINKAQSR
jgi:uncharacterized membrane protein YdbT with pleckstrin-like domain